ncbi:BON domain-containing protein [Castellaniella sp. FW104-16D08]|uniref:BON domain-containing protein n=1 Tax=unclassified Castellaniella TaxID=2617606 RepID=UPI0033146329
MSIQNVPKAPDDEQCAYLGSLKLFKVLGESHMKKSAIASNIVLATALGFGSQAGVLAAEQNTNADQSATAAEAVSDAWITTKIKTQLATTKDLSSTDVSVETNNGVATLTGTVPSEIEIKKAEAVASSTKGVQKVDISGLKVKASN